MELHDLTGDGGFESAIVVYLDIRRWVKSLKGGQRNGLHARSGRVALPRAKEGIVAGRAILETLVKLRRPPRIVVDERSRVVDMLNY